MFDQGRVTSFLKALAVYFLGRGKSYNFRFYAQRKILCFRCEIQQQLICIFVTFIPKPSFDLQGSEELFLPNLHF